MNGEDLDYMYFLAASLKENKEDKIPRVVEKLVSSPGLWLPG